MFIIKYQEDEFEKVKQVCKPSECDHSEIVKLSVNSAHTDYGCLKWKMASYFKEDFERTHKGNGDVSS